MKLRQNLRHWAAKKALTTPVIGEFATEKLVDMHTGIFLGKADEARREERRAHLDAFFDATMDSYVAALEAGYPEAEAREITHVQSNFDFFTSHGITIDDPLGEFTPADGIPAAPKTLEKLADPEYANAIAGFADDAYVEDREGNLHRGAELEEPDDVDVSAYEDGEVGA
jgi:hypothetical protein